MLIAHHHGPLQVLHQKDRTIVLHPIAKSHKQNGVNRPHHQSPLKMPKRAPLHILATPLSLKISPSSMLKRNVRRAVSSRAVTYREATFSGTMKSIFICDSMITIYQNYWQMEVNLTHHGYNPERRKMYPANPRNNLISTVDLAWEKSLQDQKDYLNHQIRLKKEEQLGEVNQSYTRAIQARMEEEARLNKSSFRVMPNYPADNKPLRENNNSAFRDSLADQLVNFRDKTKGQTASLHFQSSNPRYDTQNIRNHIVNGTDNRKKPIQNSSNVSSSVFGYNINYQTFKRESYMSKLLSDRLQPYLSKSVDKKIPKHSTFTINSPVPVYYE